MIREILFLSLFLACFLSIVFHISAESDTQILCDGKKVVRCAINGCIIEDGGECTHE
jgi:hypothetical protein